MDIPESNSNSGKLILIVLFFLIGLALGIFASAMSFQKKIANLQSQIVSLEQTKCESTPTPSNAVESPNMPNIPLPGEDAKP